MTGEKGTTLKPWGNCEPEEIVMSLHDRLVIIFDKSTFKAINFKSDSRLFKDENVRYIDHLLVFDLLRDFFERSLAPILIQ